MSRALGKAAVLLILLVAPVLAGCGPFAIVEGATTMGADKTASDMAISWASGKNCSVVRLEKGLTYCEEDERPVIDPDVYCYRTLADVTCYSAPRSDQDPESRMGQNEHNFLE